MGGGNAGPEGKFPLASRACTYPVAGSNSCCQFWALGHHRSVVRLITEVKGHLGDGEVVDGVFKGLRAADRNSEGGWI